MMHSKYTAKHLLTLIFLSVMATACSVGVKAGAPDKYAKNWDEIPDAVPKKETKSKYGNPDSYEVFGKRYYVMDSSDGFTQKGDASWYGTKFHGQRASSGETYNMYAMTAAHKTLPLPTYVEVKNLSNGRKAVVKVGAKAPFPAGLFQIAVRSCHDAHIGTQVPGPSHTTKHPGFDHTQQFCLHRQFDFTYLA